MQVWEAAVLGLIQGITEWFPVSSSGHLAIAQAGMGLAPPLLFTALLHMATLAAVLISMRAEVKLVVGGSREVLKGLLRGRKYAELVAEEPRRKLGMLIVLGTIPAGLLGFFFEGYIELTFTSIPFVGAALIVTGLVILATKGRNGPVGLLDMNKKHALAQGIAQAAALFPGISRSGFTITAGLFSGMERGDAARFSFLLAAPAIFGAAVFELRNVAWGRMGMGADVLVGMAVAFVSGYVAVTFVLKFVRERGLAWFAPYCLVVGALVLAWGLGVF